MQSETADAERVVQVLVGALDANSRQVAEG